MSDTVIPCMILYYLYVKNESCKSAWIVYINSTRNGSLSKLENCQKFTGCYFLECSRTPRLETPLFVFLKVFNHDQSKYGPLCFKSLSCPLLFIFHKSCHIKLVRSIKRLGLYLRVNMYKYKVTYIK